MVELLDIYDGNRVKTGRINRRGELLKPEDYHLISIVWIRNKAGLYLISRRSPEKQPWPNLWESTGGAALAGDNSLDAALREVREELGIELNPANGRLLYKHILPNIHRDVWLFNQEVNIDNVIFQEGETCDAKWASEDEILQMIFAEEFVPVAIEYIEQLFKDAKT